MAGGTALHAELAGLGIIDAGRIDCVVNFLLCEDFTCLGDLVGSSFVSLVSFAPSFDMCICTRRAPVGQSEG